MATSGMRGSQLHSPGDLITETDRVPMHSPKVQVYRQNDLRGDLDEAREAGNCAYYLRLALDPDARLASAPDNPELTASVCEKP